jgi:hypothetical protein
VSPSAERARPTAQHRQESKHDRTPAPRPAKYSTGGGQFKPGSGKSGGGLLYALQTVASSESASGSGSGRLTRWHTAGAVASMKHQGRELHVPSVKPMGVNGQYSKVAL